MMFSEVFGLAGANLAFAPTAAAGPRGKHEVRPCGIRPVRFSGNQAIRHGPRHGRPPFGFAQGRLGAAPAILLPVACCLLPFPAESSL